MESFLEKTLGATGHLPPSAEGHLDLDLQRIGSQAPHSREWALLAGAASDIRSLSMADVRLSSLNGFPHLGNLVKLNLSDNRVVSVEPLVKAKLARLKHLDLSNNNIADFKTVQFLQLLPALQHLYLLECPVSKLDDYREMVFDLLPGLQSLDGEDADGEEVDEDDELESEDGDGMDDAASSPRRTGGKVGSSGGKLPSKSNHGGKRPGGKSLTGKQGGKSLTGKQGGKSLTGKQGGKSIGGKSYGRKAPQARAEDDEDASDGGNDVEEESNDAYDYDESDDEEEENITSHKHDGADDEEDIEDEEEDEDEEDEEDYEEEYDDEEDDDEDEEEDLVDEDEDDEELASDASGDDMDAVTEFDYDNPTPYEQPRHIPPPSHPFTSQIAQGGYGDEQDAAAYGFPNGMDDVPTLQRNTHLGKRRVSEVNGLDPLSPMDGTLALDFLEDDDGGVDDSGEEDEVVTKKQRRK